ncbi:hypothetical protein PHLGIDRAFT_101637 [Phlebiopsis gigantea 11061_1 CR5-6]|uniref:Diaminopimelate epimerase-like protein n=1 Tax=Phlebiopsis gigantea (strain 11061_1 CR5-6) TaxID=745531 RepID=A0A0C3SBI9_PHLG1|nr:hypothetical protein PHLGIDRAFT_101637 [Phlebiopsis gigantea 11061_1 CR5-6]
MSAPLYIVNAFTTGPYAGNPAALVLVDEFPESQTMQKIAANLNQPMTAFLRPTSTITNDAASVSYDVRWHTPTKEVPICGHATLATSGLLFSEPSVLPSSVASISYRTAQGAELTARKDGDWIEITLPSTEMHSPPPEAEKRITAVVRKALGEDAQIAYIGIGGEGFGHYMMVEVDEAYNLGAREINFEALLAPEIVVNVITSKSSQAGVAFVSRMFAPAIAVPAEDHVCGSAHCLLAPYWSAKLGKGDEEMRAKQVSARGGDLKVRFLGSQGRVALGGQTKTTLKGSVLL